MSLTPGTRLGHYEILAEIGAGGMGVVYRARDSRLGREVALKVMAVPVGNDPDRLRRFAQEGRAAAALNHPNIVAVYDVGSEGSVSYVVTELLRGETLRQRLRRNRVPLPTALDFALQIAGGLAAAHAKGIIHRDLKPENVFITQDGQIKILDFGIAKLGVDDDELGKTATLGATIPGAILGTLGYVSPEHARGKPADRRSDIFAFGAVLYEMLSGRPAFLRDTAADTISAVIKEEPPPLSDSLPDFPPALQRLVNACLNKDPEQRWHSARDLYLELNWVAQEGGVAAASGEKSGERRREKLAWAVAAVCIVLLAAAVLVRRHGTPQTQAEPLRLSMLPPESTSFAPYSFAISPDGRRVAFVATGAEGKNTLWIRSLAAATGEQLTGTEGASYPFWSWDDRQLGFFAEGKLKTIDPGGGVVRIVCDASLGTGGTWNDQGTIVFAPLQTGPLYKVPASGGTPVQATKITSSVGAHRWPSFLPDGNHFLYFVDWSTGPNSVPNGIYVGSLDSMDSKLISSEIAGNTQFAAGRFFYVRDRSLMEQPFDAQRLQTTGPALPVVAQELEQETAFSRAGFSVSANGVVVFQSAAETSSRLAWFDRGGKELSEVGEVGYRDPAFSRDGRLLAVSSDDDRNGKHYIRVYDFTRGTSSRISDTGSELFPVFSPDGTTVAYGAGDEKGSYLGARAADGSGTPRRLAAGRNVIPNDWSRDGRYILYMNFQSGLPSLDVYDVAAKSSRMTGHIGAEAQFSPDGKWISYYGTSPSGGITIEPFSGHSGRVQVANNGSQPRWRPDGKEIFFIIPDKKLMAVSVDSSGGKLVVGVPHALFQTRIVSARYVLFQYAVAPDGQRFLINSLPAHGAAPLTVLMNPGLVSRP